MNEQSSYVVSEILTETIRNRIRLDDTWKSQVNVCMPNLSTARLDIIQVLVFKKLDDFVTLSLIPECDHIMLTVLPCSNDDSRTISYEWADPELIDRIVNDVTMVVNIERGLKGRDLINRIAALFLNRK